MCRSSSIVTFEMYDPVSLVNATWKKVVEQSFITSEAVRTVSGCSKLTMGCESPGMSVYKILTLDSRGMKSHSDTEVCCETKGVYSVGILHRTVICNCDRSTFILNLRQYM